MSAITVTSLGRAGVNVDKNPILLDDDELRTAQNIYHDPTRAAGGGVRKRPGFREFHNDAADGPILGGIGMPIKGTALATGGGGGGLPGDSGGTGDAAGGSDSGGAPGGDMLPGGGSPPNNFTNTTPLDSSRIVVIGRCDGSAGKLGTGWYLTDEGATRESVILTSPGPPVSNNNTGNGPTSRMGGQPGLSCVINGWCYYSAGRPQAGSNVRPTIRKTNGFTDKFVASIPKNFYSGLGNTQEQSVLAVASLLGYVIVLEMEDGVPDRGRVFRIDPATDQMFECSLSSTGALATFTSVPYCVSHAMGMLVIGTYDDIITDGGQVWIYWVPTQPRADGSPNPQMVGWGGGTLDHTFSVPHCNVTAMLNYLGTLYVGTGIQESPATVFPIIYSRDNVAPGTGSTYTAVKTADGGSAANGAYWVSFVEFLGVMYASYYGPGQMARIYSFDGTTWTTVWSKTAATDLRPYSLRVEHNTLYAIGPGTVSTSKPALLSTTNGTVWTDRTAALDDNVDYQPINHIFGFDPII